MSWWTDWNHLREALGLPYDGLIFTTREMEPCPTCATKCGSYTMCKECLERRELRAVVEKAGLLKFCSHCGDQGRPKIDCPRHGR